MKIHLLDMKKHGFTHSLIKEYCGAYSKKHEDITFVFLSPTIEKGKNNKKEYVKDIWTIDTVIHLSDILEIEKDEVFDKIKEENMSYRPLSKIRMGTVIDKIDKSNKVKISRREIENIIAKYHLPKFYTKYQAKANKESEIAKNYSDNLYWSEEHNKPANPIMLLGVADMGKSYFPMKKNKNGRYIPIKIKFPKLTKMIIRNDKGKRYHVIKILNDETLPKKYQGDLKNLQSKLDSCLKKSKKIKAKDIKSDKQGLISIK